MSGAHRTWHARVDAGAAARISDPVVRVALVDDQTIFREGLRALIELEPDFEVLAQTTSAAVRLPAPNGRVIHGA